MKYKNVKSIYYVLAPTLETNLMSIIKTEEKRKIINGTLKSLITILEVNSFIVYLVNVL